MRKAGKSKPELRIAARTRSRLSRTLVSGKPDQLEVGEAVADVDLDVHRTGIDSDDGRTFQGCQHVHRSARPLPEPDCRKPA